MKRILRLLVLLIYSPSRAFDEVKESSGWMWLVPAIILIGSLCFRAIVSASASAILAKEQLEKQLSQLPQQELSNLPPVVAHGPSPVFLATTAIISGIVMLFLGWLIRSFLLHLGSLALGGQGSFGQMFVAAGWAYLPYGIRDLVQGIYSLLTGKVITQPGLSSLVATGDPIKDSANAMYLLLGRLDIFVIWSVVLLALGVSAVGGFSRKKGGFLAFGYWALVTLLSILPSLVVRKFLPSGPFGP
ncbi:MAG: hypothetical protein DRI61_09360 [Chloroflexi bacterium]|nr:MAG: hypothetical protein DRI61_09360 [Chloroflexota bacterium]HDN79911.1 YIP1 family protein [Chloroflexota bacterium]